MHIETNQAVLFAVVQPVSSPSCSNNTLELIGLHPNYLIDTLIP